MNAKQILEASIREEWGHDQAMIRETLATARDLEDHELMAMAGKAFAVMSSGEAGAPLTTEDTNFVMAGKAALELLDRRAGRRKRFAEKT